MIPLFFNLLFLLVLIAVILSVVFLNKFSRKTLMLVYAGAFLVMLLIVSTGHSTTWLKYQLQSRLNHIETNEVNIESDRKAVAEIESLPHPVHFRIISMKKTGHEQYDVVIQTEANKERCRIRMISYTEPLRWVPFNDFQLNQVNKIP
ncbi:hypothetical protein [Geobacillus jurassicus]|uniref:Uncharacterized protein n=1 Tax=Geobacillus jurassicus TaxID=235932 RepID=A0ABV6GPW9_9BACL|nr:hypothetical protein [Geobacillus jurassicus]